MSPLYPELKNQEKTIIALLKSEVEKFRTTFVHGKQILEKYFVEQGAHKVISGLQAFKLYDTYGFPLELTKVMAQEAGFVVDTEGFEAHMEQQRIQSGKKLVTSETIVDESLETTFTGYDEHRTETTIIGLVAQSNSVQEVPAGTEVYVITEQSPFFVECGGQVSDQGFIRIGEKDIPLRALKKFGKTIGAFIETPVALKVGDRALLIVDSPSRILTMKNHTATHLLQAALIEVLGKHVRQSGSVVTPDYLRFDFTHHETLSPQDIALVEDIVNKKITENIPVIVSSTTLEEAARRGVIAIFGEKYNPELVRVIEVPGFSAELCGGTHVHATGDIGCFKITEVSALSSGNRRIVAVTGPAAIELFQQTFSAMKTLGQEFKVPIEQVIDAVKKQKEQLREAQTLAKTIKKNYYLSQLPQWSTRIEHYGPVPFLYLSIKDASQEDLKEIGQELMRAQPGLYFLTGHGERIPFFVTLAPTLTSHVPLTKLAAWLREQGLQGGGTATTIQGNAQHLNLDFEYELKKWVHEHAR